MSSSGEVFITFFPTMCSAYLQTYLKVWGFFKYIHVLSTVMFVCKFSDL